MCLIDDRSESLNGTVNIEIRAGDFTNELFGPILRPRSVDVWIKTTAERECVPFHPLVDCSAYPHLPQERGQGDVWLWR